MDIFVGAEYVIANALIALSRQGVNEISFAKLRRIGWKLQELCNESRISAIILTSGNSLKDAVYDFSDYFEYDMDEKTPIIRIKKEVPITDLENRFVYCLPSELGGLISQEMPSLLSA